MRTIDADTLIDGYRHMGYDPNEHPEESYMEGWCKGFNAAVDHCMGHAIHAPTIEPERKTGQWIPVINGRGGHECDQCHEYAPSWATGEERLTKFCPNCGAKMEEGGQG